MLGNDQETNRGRHFKWTDSGWLIPNVGVFASLPHAMGYLIGHIDALDISTVQVRLY
jgi:hypothetical protein